jgi:hypothetical protein
VPVSAELHWFRKDALSTAKASDFVGGFGGASMKALASAGPHEMDVS